MKSSPTGSENPGTYTQFFTVLKTIEKTCEHGNISFDEGNSLEAF